MVEILKHSSEIYKNARNILLTISFDVIEKMPDLQATLFRAVEE